MKTSALVLLAAGLLGSRTSGAPSQESEKKKVMCTLSIVKSITDEVANGDFDVTALSKPDQDPHFVTPTPALMKKVRDASLFIEIGLQLELWADLVADGSGNVNIARSAAGRLVASRNISREEVPINPSRAQGDVHPEGNPHIWTDPMRAKTIAENIAAGLKSISPDKAAAIDGRLNKFKEKVDEAMFGPDLLKAVGSRALTRKTLDGSLWTWLEEKKLKDKVGGWLKKALPLRGMKVLEYHKTWIYLAKSFGFEIVGSIQVKPGIEPGPKHIEYLKQLIPEQKVRLMIVDNFFDPSVPNALARETGCKVANVPGQPGGEAGTDDYVKWMDYVLDRLLEAAK